MVWYLLKAVSVQFFDETELIPGQAVQIPGKARVRRVRRVRYLHKPSHLHAEVHMERLHIGEMNHVKRNESCKAFRNFFVCKIKHFMGSLVGCQQRAEPFFLLNYGF